MMAEGVQRKRIKGWRMPPNTINVTRPGKWGNPFTVGMWFKKATADWSVWICGDSPHFGNQQVRDLPHSLELFEDYAGNRVKWDKNWLAPLRDMNLACWCKLTGPCHRNTLLELANK